MKQDELMKDIEFCENAMFHVGDDLWTDNIIYEMLKVMRDILLTMEGSKTDETK